MNRGLLGFAILLVLIGVGSGIYAISVLGIFLLFPAVLTTPRPRAPRAPIGTQAPPRRIIPREAPPQILQAPQTYPIDAQVPASAVPVANPSQQPQSSYSASLFPNPMFPSFSQPLAGQQQPKKTEEKQQPQPQRDELVEAGALLTLLRLFLG